MANPRSATHLYKILTPSDYAALPTTPSSSWTGASIDLSDGFIHLSTSRQLAGTLSRFFSTEPEVWICGVERQRLGPEDGESPRLRWEEAAGTVFAHVYGTLSPAEDFTIRHKVERGRDGEWVLPELTF
ncbi:hypothetical protein BDZ90DRAFT_234789 [Jaminaea rosea]|uniref:DUF952-domain-containing protein n=1 Tax=Jaminaea rosea TaxID=1569628 RepID=A0A316UHS8_9BASI|nr:hypothetical protein BDZ90DRAFT_234789 [Jaminaea rosea]PWN24846.1 hypothetical protein BDZ90DRAFT_234789 [Jaminaea rosea]